MTTRTRAEAVLFATTFIWGSTFVVAKLIAESFSSSLYIFLRFGIGSVFFLLLFGKKLVQISKRTIRNGIFLGVILGAGIVVQNYGIYQTTASKAAFITGLMVIFTPMAQIILEKRAPKLGNIFGIIIVTVGLYLLTSPEGSGFNFGDLLVLLSAVLFGVFIVYMDIFSKDENPFHLSFVQIVSTTAVAAICIPFEEIRFQFSWNVSLLILYMSFFATVVTTYSQTRFQKDSTPTRAVIIFTIEPVIASVLAYFLLNEVLKAMGIIGAILILVGILVSQFSNQLFEIVGFPIKREIENE